MVSTRILCALLLIGIPTIVFAQATVDVQGISNILGAGARAQGMGGAFTAIADDATASSWNPAGLAQLTRPEVSLVYDQLSTNFEFDYAYTGMFGDERLTFESIEDRADGDYSDLGFASYTFPFTMGRSAVVGQISYRRMSTFPDIDNSFVTRFTFGEGANAQSVDVEEFANLEAGGGIDDFAFSLATALTSTIHLGITLNYLDADVQQRSTGADLTLDSYAIQQDFRYAFSDYFFDIGLLFKPSDRFSIGAVYHSSFSGDLDYESDLQFTLDGTPLSRVAGVPVQGSGNFEWPSGYAVGVAFRPTERFTLAADYSATNWSDAVIDDLTVASIDVVNDELVIAPVHFGPGAFPYLFARQEDTSSVRLGGEYILVLPNQLLIPLRAGYFTEKQISNFWATLDDPEDQPEYDGWSAGAGFTYRRVQLDFAYVHTEGEDEGTPGEPGSFGLETLREIIRVEQNRFLVSAIFRF
jgi:long-subunit fatty acid transport protein